MSVYERKYSGCSNMCSFHTDDPAEALRYYDQGMKAYEAGETTYPPFVDEGHADAEDIYPGHPRYRGISGTEYVRRTTRRLTRTNLLAAIAERDYQAQRRVVQEMLAGRVVR